MSEMTTTALAGWFGTNRTLAPTVGRQLGKRKWVGVPFCGGCCELPYIDCRSGVASDMHRHLVNLARVVRVPALKDELVARLDATLFHPDELARAQRACLARERQGEPVGLFATVAPVTGDDAPSVDWAYDYFICSWMGRGGNAGTPAEFRQGLSVRWNANGGDSCTRFRSATGALDAWCPALFRWNFLTLDALEFLDNVEDDEGNGLYADAPWPGPGDKYTHRFPEAKQRKLAAKLATYRKTRAVIRFGLHPLIEELYPRDRWNYVEQNSRSQANGDVAEVLIINGRSVAAEAA